MKPTPEDVQQFPAMAYLVQDSENKNWLVMLLVGGGLLATLWTAGQTNSTTDSMLVLLTCTILLIFLVTQASKRIGVPSKFVVLATYRRTVTDTMETVDMEFLAYDAQTSAVRNWTYAVVASKDSVPSSKVDVALQNIKSNKMIVVTVSAKQYQQIAKYLAEQTVVDGKVFWAWASVKF